MTVKLVTRASKLKSLADLDKFSKDCRFHFRFVWLHSVGLSSQQLHLLFLRVTGAVTGREAIRWLVWVSWQQLGLRRGVTWHVTALEWFSHQWSCPWEVDLVSGKVFVQLQANASLERWKNHWALPCVELSILSLENDNDCLSFKYNFFKIF